MAEVTNAEGDLAHVLDSREAGIIRYTWDMRSEAATAAAAATGDEGGRAGGGGARPASGTYALKLTLGASTATGSIVVRDDPLSKQ